jgi:hypothetical protein
MENKALNKVRDHDHLTGKYRGAAHCKCNINYFCNRYLPIVFHNLRGYDGHQIIQEAYNLFPNEDISVIPNSYEKFMSFKFGPLKFIDSFQFMASSLESLVENLYNSGDDKYIDFPCMKQYFKEDMDILCRKGFYPYEFIDSDDKLTKTIIYNLNPADNELMATMIGNFNDGSVAGKIQFGSAWWFLDQKDGMERQVNALSNLGLLSRFVGMLTDSRSFLSYPRHEYFRRIVCNLFGNEIEEGELPNDIAWTGKIIQDICFNNANEYFGWDGKS